MKALIRFPHVLTFATLTAPAALFAHPGHDGDHDFTWDFSHLAAHPVATFFCATVLGVAVWAIVRATRSSNKKHDR